ncbi:siroheme synthase CysG [Serratia microhaemolytica]|uniref:siroheme synthase CysG n=1 Tax=Serratia microhaemolytica TaxID=2675110 RepID=UPI000FDF1802|nr:siroheme synthase CysG [Serratia microhaemolytica]
MDYLPIFCQLKQKACLLVGGGEVAERKARLLLAAGAQLTVNALEFSTQFHHWAEQQQLTLVKAPFSSNLLAGKWLVIACTDSSSINNQVYHAANQQQIFCNVVDDAQHTSFIMPAVIDRSPLVIALSSGGRAPVLIRQLREKLEAQLPQHLGQLAELAGTLRQRVKQQFSKLTARRRFWERFFTHQHLAQSLANRDQQQANQQIEKMFSQHCVDHGEVALVGAGPGDAGLLTLKALQQIQQADVVVYDRLVSAEVMALVRRDATRVFVGKQPGQHCITQEKINQTLLTLAQQGLRVVRLKGGDPFIFGRGGEELQALAQAGIPFSVVPGITAASGCSAYSGIPLTHRDHAQSLCLITGHTKQDRQLNWSQLANTQQTLVFYMGLAQAAEIQQQLLDHRMPASTAVALIENGTTRQQRVVVGRLDQLTLLANQVVSPSLIIIGNVVQLRQQLNWFHGEQDDSAVTPMVSLLR